MIETVVAVIVCLGLLGCLVIIVACMMLCKHITDFFETQAAIKQLDDAEDTGYPDLGDLFDLCPLWTRDDPCQKDCPICHGSGVIELTPKG
jgi:hypothetical protein